MNRDEDPAPEEIERFFDERAAGYDDHMRQILGDNFERIYQAVAAAIEPTDAEIHVLDLGAGTGAELTYVLARAPHARCTCVDLSSEMLARLERRYSAASGRIECVRRSFLDQPFPRRPYAYVISVMAMHHYDHVQKLALYRKIRERLAARGRYVVGDYFVSPAEERAKLAKVRQKTWKGTISSDRLYHIDIPSSIPTEKRLLLETGFSSVEILFETEKAAVLAAQRL